MIWPAINPDSSPVENLDLQQNWKLRRGNFELEEKSKTQANFCQPWMAFGKSFTLRSSLWPLLHYTERSVDTPNIEIATLKFKGSLLLSSCQEGSYLTKMQTSCSLCLLKLNCRQMKDIDATSQWFIKMVAWSRVPLCWTIEMLTYFFIPKSIETFCHHSSVVNLVHWCDFPFDVGYQNHFA